MARGLVDMGCDSLCIKDMAALLRPQPAYDIVKGIKDACGDAVRVHVHTHATTGVTLVSLMKAIEAGADCVDTAISSLSLGPGHNPTESLVEMLEGTGFTTRVDKERLRRIKDHFNTVRPRYAEFLSNITGVETDVLKVGSGLADLKAAVDAALVFSSPSVSFGSVPSGSGKARTQTVTVTNVTGGSVSVPVTITSANVAGAFKTTTTTVSLASGASATIPVTYYIGKLSGASLVQAQLNVGTEHVALFALAK